MEKRYQKIAAYVVLVVSVLLLLLVLFQYQAMRERFPTLSPYFPDLAPFNVSVTILSLNHNPVILDLNSSIFVCEDTSLGDYYFTAMDLDVEDNLTGNIYESIPPFYLWYDSRSTINASFHMFYLNSIPLNKLWVGSAQNGWRVYERIVSVLDDKGASDSVQVNFTAIEINHGPWFVDNPPVGVQTIIWTQGENATFYKQVLVNDVEDTNQESTNLNFNISITNSSGNRVNLFNISNNGVMNFTADSSTPPGIYDIIVCVNDTFLNPHPNISYYCGQTGESMSNCTSFSLTVTDQNRPPNITSYYPNDLTLDVPGTNTLYFNMTEYDPDWTIPDAYWYVGGIIVEYDNNSLFDEFSYSFGCDVSGLSNITAEITDGELNDSIQWNISIINVPCPQPPAQEGGSSGGSNIKACEELWGCDGWRVCENVQEALEGGILTGEDYRIIQENCSILKLDEETCGMQTRSCIDAHYCNTTRNKLMELQACHYTDDPRCDDGIKNCHDGGCELLIDCGGPCSQCPTCSDKIQNQNERGIDCGGPCPWECEAERPLDRKYIIIGGIILLLLIILIIISIWRILKYREIKSI
ncbi:MAG: hypothetical protein ABIB79_02170 [archaeon]